MRRTLKSFSPRAGISYIGGVHGADKYVHSRSTLSLSHNARVIFFLPLSSFVTSHFLQITIVYYTDCLGVIHSPDLRSCSRVHTFSLSQYSGEACSVQLSTFWMRIHTNKEGHDVFGFLGIVSDDNSVRAVFIRIWERITIQLPCPCVHSRRWHWHKNRSRITHKTEIFLYIIERKY